MTNERLDVLVKTVRMRAPSAEVRSELRGSYLSASLLPSVARRLPVIQTPPSEDEAAEQRPAAEWVLIGSVLVLALFFPLSALGLWFGSLASARLGQSPTAAAIVRALPILLSFAASAAASGALLGRFALRASRRSVLLSGALGGFAIVVLASLGGALRPPSIAAAAGFVLIASGAIFAQWGSRFGRRRRPNQPTPPLR